jgi:hypothetical protein
MLKMKRTLIRRPGCRIAVGAIAAVVVPTGVTGAGAMEVCAGLVVITEDSAGTTTITTTDRSTDPPLLVFTAKLTAEVLGGM